MFFERKYLVFMIVYILISLGLSFSGLRSIGVIYIEEFRNMNYFFFAYEFYLNIFNTVSPDVSDKYFESEVMIIGAKLIISFSLINFCYGQIERSPWLAPATYLIAAPVFLYLLCIYIEPNNYVTFHANSVAFIGSLILGLSIGDVIKAKEKFLSFSDVIFSIIGVSLLYYFEYSEFQSTLLISIFGMIFLGFVVGLINSQIKSLSYLS